MITFFLLIWCLGLLLKNSQINSSFWFEIKLTWNPITTLRKWIFSWFESRKQVTTSRLTQPKNIIAVDPLVLQRIMFYKESEKLTLNCWERHAKPQPQDLSSTLSFQDQWIIIMSSPWMSMCMYDKHAVASIPEALCTYIHTSHVFVWVHFTDDWMIRCNVHSRKSFSCSTWGRRLLKEDPRYNNNKLHTNIKGS